MAFFSYSDLLMHTSSLEKGRLAIEVRLSVQNSSLHQWISLWAAASIITGFYSHVLQEKLNFQLLSPLKMNEKKREILSQHVQRFANAAFICASTVSLCFIKQQYSVSCLLLSALKDRYSFFFSKERVISVVLAEQRMFTKPSFFTTS